MGPLNSTKYLEKHLCVVSELEEGTRSVMRKEEHQQFEAIQGVKSKKQFQQQWDLLRPAEHLEFLMLIHFQCANDVQVYNYLKNNSM